MTALLDNLAFGKYLIFYVLLISLGRGIFFPDFRYDVISIVIIQVIYPIALFAPMTTNLHAGNTWGYYILGLGGIALAALLAWARYYFEAGKENVTDQVSMAVMFSSIAAQIGLYSALVILLVLVAKAKSPG